MSIGKRAQNNLFHNLCKNTFGKGLHISGNMQLVLWCGMRGRRAELWADFLLGFHVHVLLPYEAQDVWCVCMCVFGGHVHMCVCTYGGQKTTLGVTLHPSTLFCETRSLTGMLGLPIWLRWLASEPQESTCF